MQERATGRLVVPCCCGGPTGNFGGAQETQGGKRESDLAGFSTDRRGCGCDHQGPDDPGKERRQGSGGTEGLEHLAKGCGFTGPKGAWLAAVVRRGLRENQRRPK